MAQPSAVAGILGKTALFGSLSQADRLLVAAQMRKAAYKANQIIFERGAPGRDLFLLLEGRVRLSVFSADGRMLSFNLADAGEIFGEIAVLDGGTRTADATAVTPTVVMTLSQARVNELLEKNPRVARAAITYLCARLRRTSEQAETIALQPIEARLAKLFLAKLKVREASGDATAKAPLDIGMSQGELALLVGASRQKVNVALTVLENAGGIKRVGSHFACNAGKLARIASKGRDRQEPGDR